MQTIALTACPVCGSADSQAVESGRAGVELRGCHACGTVFAAEYADPAEVFKEGYLSGKTGDFGIDLSHPRFHRFLLRCGARRMDIVERATGLRGGTLCDVGCGTGELLEAAAARGWTVQGVEPLEDASARVRAAGLPVAVSTLEESGLPQAAYDVVAAMHVLEHMPSATDFLGSVARWAKPGGYVAIESPNWASVQRVVYQGNWSALRPLEHLIHLTPDSLRQAFVNAGLEPVEVTTTSHLDDEHTLEEALEALGRPHWKPRFSGLPRPAQRAALRLLDRRDERRGKGAAVFGVARRPA